MRITDLIRAEGHPRARAKLVVPGIPAVTGEFSPEEWTKLNRNVVRRLYDRHRDSTARSSHKWFTAFWGDLYENHRSTWNMMYYFAQTPELLVVPEYHIGAALNSAWCPVCAKQWVPQNQEWGCYTCTLNDPKIRWSARNAKAKVTLKENWGVEHPSHIPGRMDSYKARTGYDNPLQNPEVIRKVLTTRKARPQVEAERVLNVRANWKSKSAEEIADIGNRRWNTLRSNPEALAQRSKKLRETWGTYDFESRNGKSVKTYLERTGYEYPSQNPEVRTKMINTWLRTLGVAHPRQSREVNEKVKRTNLDRRGVENPTQDPKIARKALLKSAMLHEVEVEGRVFKVQGSYEKELVQMLCEKFGTENLSTQFDEAFPDVPGWTPDFYVHSRKFYVECKSLWTLCGRNWLDKNREKARALKNCKWLVRFGDEWLTLPEDWHDYQNIVSLIVGRYLKKKGHTVLFVDNGVQIDGQMFHHHELANTRMLLSRFRICLKKLE